MELQERIQATEVDLELEEIEEDATDMREPPQLSKREESEARMINDRMLKERLGQYTQLVTRFLDSQEVQRNYMPVLTTAAESLR